MVVLDLIRDLWLTHVLIVAPWLVAREVWLKESQRWDHLRDLHVTALIGTPDARRARLLAPSAVTVINPELLPWLADTLGEDWPFTTVVFDESTRLKGYRASSRFLPRPGSRPGRATKRAASLAQHAHHRVQRWINLSGTPVANGYLDLWGPQWFVDGGLALGRTFGAYKARWFEPENAYSPHPRLKLKPYSELQIQERLKPTTHAVRAQDWFTLLTPVERTICIELPPDARRAYTSMQRHLAVDLNEGRVSALNAGVKAGKLRQIASGAVYRDEREDSWSVVHEERLEALASLQEELAGAPLLVVIQYRHEAVQILKRFPQAVEIHAPGALERWNAGQIPMLVLHAASAGHGLNLQHGGHHICYYSPYSDNELYSQVLERIGPVRQQQAGFDRNVFIHHLEAHDTVDQQTRGLREGRLTQLQAFMQAASLKQ